MTMGKRIILEGPDGAGKTTLAKILADKYGLDVCHCTQHDPADYDFYRQSVRKNNVVWDRHTIGELIYPQVFSRYPKIGTEDARLVIHYAKEEGTKIFVLTEDLELIRKRLDERGTENKKIIENIKWINDQFVFYANQFHIPVISTSKMTLNEMYKLVEE